MDGKDYRNHATDGAPPSSNSTGETSRPRRSSAMALRILGADGLGEDPPSVTEWNSVMSVELERLDVGGDTAVPGSALRIPALELAGVDATRMATLAFVENEQRENLSFLDTAMAVSRMLDDWLSETVEAAAAAPGRSFV